MKCLNKVSKIHKKIINRLRIKSPNAIKWGIIGTGYMAEVFADAIESNKDGRVYAVGSRKMEKSIKFAKKYHKAIAYGSYEELVMDSNIDIIYIATPTFRHYEDIKLCLKNKKNVLCEKPITLNKAELELLISIANENNVFLMEGMWTKCLPTYQKAIELVKNNTIGKINLIRVDFYKNEIIKANENKFDKKNGGVLKDFGIYALSFPISFIDMNLPISIISKVNKSYLGLDSNWQIIMGNSDVDIFINLSNTFNSKSKAFVEGTNGRIEWEDKFNRTNKIVLYDKDGKIKEKIKYKYKNEGFEYEIDEVQKCLKNKKVESKKVPLKESLFAIDILERILNDGK